MKMPPRFARKPSWRKNYWRKSSKFLLRQIVNLQANRISPGSLNRVNDFYHVAIFQGPRRLYEYGFLNALIFRNVGGRFHSHLVGVLLFALLEGLLQLGGERAGIVDRAHGVLIEFDLQ